MIKVITTIAVFLIGLFSIAQVSENRNVGSFSKLKASHAIDVFYTVSSERSITVTSDNLEKISFIKTEIEGEILKIYVETGDKKEKITKKQTKKKYVNWVNGVEFQVLKVTVSGPALKGIKVSSSADVKLENENTVDNLEIESSSSGSVTGTFNCTMLTVDASSSSTLDATIKSKEIKIKTSSSSDVKLQGKAQNIEVKSSSSSECDLEGLYVENAKVEASSSSDIILNVSKSINAKASSSADIVFYGNPTQISTEKSSSGSITKK